jgi:hypothetical protein
MFWACACILRYPACNAHALYCHLWFPPLYSIFFSTLSHKQYDFHKVYTFKQHIYNLLQSIHRLHVSAHLGHHQTLHMNRLVWLQYILQSQSFIKMLLKCCVLLNILNIKRMLKTDVEKTNVKKEIILVTSSLLPSFSVRFLALTTCNPLLILIFLRGLFTSRIFSS